MHAILKKATLAAALATASLSAHAVETQITVYANVDPTLAFLQHDGSPLPDSINLVHNPLTGLVPWNRQVRIFSNDESADVAVRLGHAPTLTSTSAGATPVPLSVKLNNKALTVAAQDFAATELFDGAVPGASITMPFQIAQATATPITAAGYYEGLVNVIMVQKAASP